ncbi:Ebp2-domain-containing protein [Violaceomyces palustris]|uniref:Ebp2-domain-containing protein n=1 Tax=Violaceomyces palustris TaxID=1673888 RepID=A0ACD0NMN2_9BASI|nr:Ebp2-domain-containing protein [Violaceomyces palustris]
MAKTPTKAASTPRSKTASRTTPTKSNASNTPSKQQGEEPKEQTIVESEDDVDVDEDDDDSDAEDGVSEKGLQRLMKALGDDGLTELDMAALRAARGEVEDEEDEEEEEDEEDEEEEEEEEDDDDEDDDEGEEEEDDEVDNEDEKDEAGEEGDDDEEDGLPKVVPNKNGDTLAASIARSGLVPVESEEEEDGEEEEDEEEEGEEEEIAYEDLPDNVQLSEQAKASRKQRIKINNEEAIRRIHDEIRLDGGQSSTASSAKTTSSKSVGLPWIETMRVTYDKVVEDEVPDPDNDLQRELAFYKQSLHAVIEGKKLVEAAGVAFSRPADFFAEMVKSDEHMERVRQRLLDESAAIKASEAAKKQRELKKFGKKVQVEKLEERQRKKREMNEKVKNLKRKHAGDDGGANDEDDFDVRLEDALDDSKPARGGAGGARRGQGKGKDGRAKMPRTVRDEKYGFGGKKRRAKSNTAESTNDFGGFGGARGGGAGGRGGKRKGGSTRGGKGGGSSKRPGKSARASGKR